MCDLPTSQGASVAKEIGDNVLFMPMDVTSEDDVKNALAETKSKYGFVSPTPIDGYHYLVLI